MLQKVMGIRWTGWTRLVGRILIVISVRRWRLIVRFIVGTSILEGRIVMGRGVLSAVSRVKWGVEKGQKSFF